MDKTPLIQGEKADETPTVQEGQSSSVENNELVSEMMNLGVFYGQSKSRTNPKMRKYILANRSGFSVINLEKTIVKLEATKKLIKEVTAKREKVMVVGTSPAVRGAVKQLGEELDLPYVTERWLGGTLTNFDTISKRIKHLKKLKEEQKNNAWDKYTKKEKLDKERELNKLDKLFGGIEDLEKPPGLLIVADTTNNESATREARALDIPVIGLLNTDADPAWVDIGIPANDKNIKSVEFLLDQIKDMIKEGIKTAPAPKVEEEGEKENKKKEKK